MSEQQYEFHPYADVFPLMTKTELRELTASIQGRGLKIPIVLYEGKILDGRNRYTACRQAGVEPHFEYFNGDDDPVEFIVERNLRRRQLSESQKGLVVAKIANLPRGNPSLKKPANEQKAQQTPNPPRGGFSEAQAAKTVGVGERTVSRGKRVLREGSKDQVKAVESGEKTLGEVEKEIKRSKSTPPQTGTKEEQQRDKTGFLIPTAILDDWKRAEAFGANLREISRIKSELSKGLEDKDPIFIRELNSSAVALLQNIYSELKGVIPYAVCTSCQGRQRTKCSLCKGSGFISQFAYNQFVPAETKELRKKVVQK